MSDVMTDRYGRMVRFLTDGVIDTYVVLAPGPNSTWEVRFTLTWAAGHPRALAMDSIEAHAPADWVEPVSQEG